MEGCIVGDQNEIRSHSIDDGWKNAVHKVVNKKNRVGLIAEDKNVTYTGGSDESEKIRLDGGLRVLSESLTTAMPRTALAINAKATVVVVLNSLFITENKRINDFLPNIGHKIGKANFVVPVEITNEHFIWD